MGLLARLHALLDFATTAIPGMSPPMGRGENISTLSVTLPNSEHIEVPVANPISKLWGGPNDGPRDFSIKERTSYGTK